MTTLSIEIRHEESGPVVETVPVGAADLVDAYGELWWKAFVRKGCAAQLPQEGAISLEPVFREGKPPYCAGFVLAAENQRGERTRCVFSRRSVEHVAQRAVSTLRTGEEADVLFFYDLRADHGATHQDSLPKSLEGTARGLSFSRLPLASLLAGAERSDNDIDSHVFYTRSALEAAERASRRGGERDPPVETGGLLVGPLCLCPHSGDVFCIICDVLEAKEAESARFSLSYSAATWNEIHAVLRARREVTGMEAHRILGQTHGHNFLPMGGAEPCEACSQQAVCSRSTAYLSTADLKWCRAVFSGQPWQLSHIFGLNARGEKVDAFFGLAGGCLAPRGFHVLDDFDPSTLEKVNP